MVCGESGFTLEKESNSNDSKDISFYQFISFAHVVC